MLKLGVVALRDHQMSSLIITVIFQLWMLLELLLDVRDLFFFDILSANGASLLLRQRELDLSAVRVFFRLPWHEPISVNASEMESVEAAADPDQVDAISKQVVFLILILTEFFQTDGASAFDGVVVLRDYLSHRLVNVKQVA